MERFMMPNDMMIRKGEHNGWSVHVSGISAGCSPSAAYFSTIPEMLEWIKGILEKALPSNHQ